MEETMKRGQQFLSSGSQAPPATTAQVRVVRRVTAQLMEGTGEGGEHEVDGEQRDDSVRRTSEIAGDFESAAAATAGGGGLEGSLDTTQLQCGLQEPTGEVEGNEDVIMGGDGLAPDREVEGTTGAAGTTAEESGPFDREGPKRARMTNEEEEGSSKRKKETPVTSGKTTQHFQLRFATTGNCSDPEYWARKEMFLSLVRSNRVNVLGKHAVRVLQKVVADFTNRGEGGHESPEFELKFINNEAVVWDLGGHWGEDRADVTMVILHVCLLALPSTVTFEDNFHFWGLTYSHFESVTRGWDSNCRQMKSWNDEWMQKVMKAADMGIETRPEGKVRELRPVDPQKFDATKWNAKDLDAVGHKLKDDGRRLVRRFIGDPPDESVFLHSGVVCLRKIEFKGGSLVSWTASDGKKQKGGGHGKGTGKGSRHEKREGGEAHDGVAELSRQTEFIWEVEVIPPTVPASELVEEREKRRICLELETALRAWLGMTASVGEIEEPVHAHHPEPSSSSSSSSSSEQRRDYQGTVAPSAQERVNYLSFPPFF
uniref:Uncharacterized protein n=1 Tax=Chromera velia CCMP2878 TaxID=1169474 RepID=A0A0G4HTV2_9ALVE|eukprot:Cvel_31607.t1-p1 / transcript=Cvel_31607.t1 / gene=Cvel_31607 / organism=Chromera_velia_CCMP2878 / gene_product=hypothetical protein / transcript_product=hypothetical protein / location=Cvel_scaffold4743:1623-5126(-) / protein_length=540 / sequence_SO=supercontig / SO=protein_coding / is_pseudo=false